MVQITTECLHRFEISAEREAAWQEQITDLASRGAGASGATFDCKVCGQLCILVSVADERAVFGRLFHVYMHEQDEGWPADGQETGVVEFEINERD
jgi:hypothetical protein